MSTITINPASTGDILIVDDTQSDLKLLSDILRKAGYTVRPATDGELALRSVQAKLPDLVLLDIRMPDLDGYEVCRRLKDSEDTRDIPVIFISVKTSPIEKAKTFGLGGVDYISKPFEPEEVLARVATHLSLRKEQKEVEQKNMQLQQEIAGRKRAEGKIEHLNLVLRAIRKVNQLITKERGRDRLIQGACDTLIETRGYFNVWIVLIDDSGKFVIIAESGLGKDFFSMAEMLKNGKMPHCGQRALKQSELVVTENPLSTCTDCPLSKHYSGRGAMTIRLEHRGRVYGLISASIPRDFLSYKEEQSLFQEVSGDIAFALYNIELEKERKHVEKELRKYEHIISAAQEHMSLLDRNYIYQAVNNAYLKAHSKNRDEIVGHSVAELLGQKPFDELVKDKLDRCLAGEEIHYRWWLDFPALGRRYMDVAYYPFFEEDRSISGVVVASRDITETQQLETQLQQSQKLESVGRLAGGVAHDFNNILTVIMGNAELLSSSLGKDNPLQGRVEEISKGGERAASLTRQLLAFSRRQVLQPQVLDLNSVIPNIDKMLRRLIGEDIDLETVLAPDLGSVEADPGQIEQVLMNLSVNARDAMPTGGKLTIETANVDLDEAYASKHVAVKPGPYVMMAISDNGTGMDEETRSNIFEPFYTTKDKDKGTGLGLSTVYGIVKQSGGNIWVYSEPKKGTIFKIYLPRVEKVAETAEKLKDTNGSLTGSETIMVAEDDDRVRDLARSILQRYGYSVLDAQDGESAIRLSEKHEGDIHLMLTDVVMPGMSGRVLAERLAGKRPKMKVLYMSGYTDNAIVHHGVLGKEMNFLQKPFTIESLAKKVREVLDE